MTRLRHKFNDPPNMHVGDPRKCSGCDTCLCDYRQDANACSDKHRAKANNLKYRAEKQKKATQDIANRLKFHDLILENLALQRIFEPSREVLISKGFDTGLKVSHVDVSGQLVGKYGNYGLYRLTDNLMKIVKL